MTIARTIARIAATIAVAGGTVLAAGATGAGPAVATEPVLDRASSIEIPADPEAVLTGAAPGTVFVDPDAGPTAGAPAAGTLALACNGAALLGSGTKAAPEYWRPVHVFSSGTFWPDCWMGSGYRSWGVVALQMGLRDCYGQGIPLDGIYGPLTVGSVKNVQRFHGWSVDGVYGTQTGRMAFPSNPKGRFFPHC